MCEPIGNATCYAVCDTVCESIGNDVCYAVCEPIGNALCGAVCSDASRSHSRGNPAGKFQKCGRRESFAIPAGNARKKNIALLQKMFFFPLTTDKFFLTFRASYTVALHLVE